MNNTDQKICFGNRVVKQCVPIVDNPTFISKSRQYRLYKNGQTKCSCCGVEATHVAQYRQNNEPKGQYNHVDLFHMRKRSALLMTVDHILPVSCGGGNQFSNYRMMCASCNTRRGNNIKPTELIEILNNPKLYIGDSGEKKCKFDAFLDMNLKLQSNVYIKTANYALSIILFVLINKEKDMKTNFIKSTELPNGYIFTGEYRVPKIGELFYSTGPVFNMLHSWHKVSDNVWYNSKQWKSSHWIVIDINKWLEENTHGKTIGEIESNLRKSCDKVFQYNPFEVHGSLWKEFNEKYLNPYIKKLEKKVFNKVYDFGYGNKLYYSYFYFSEKANSYIK